MKFTLTVLISALALQAGSAFASEPCTCRAANVEVREGETICLVTPRGPQMARCEKVLNNTSWSFLDQPCSDNISRAPGALPDLAPPTVTAGITG